MMSPLMMVRCWVDTLVCDTFPLARRDRDVTSSDNVLMRGKYYDPGGGIQRAEGRGNHQIITFRNIPVYQEVTLRMVIVVI